MKQALFLILCLLFIFGLGCENEEDEVTKSRPAKIPDPGTESCDPALSINQHSPAFSIIADGCNVSWKNITGQLAVMEGSQRKWYALSQWPLWKADKSRKDDLLKVHGHATLPDVMLSFSSQNRGIVIQTTVISSKAENVVAGFRFSGHLDLPDEPRTIHWLHHGYQSWTFTGAVELTPLDEPLPDQEGAEAALGNNYDYWYDQKPVSWWVTGLRSKQNPYGLVSGALTAKLFKTYFTAKWDRQVSLWRLSAITGTPGDYKKLIKGSTLTLDPLYIRTTLDPVRALDQYADEVAKTTPPLVWEGFEPRGWATWYDYFDEVSEQDVLTNLYLMRDLYLDHGFGVCQLDDGYMIEWGDWQQTNERFPSGLGTLAEKIDLEGLVPGIWVAPFMASTGSQLYAEHPDWFLNDENGDPIQFGDMFMKDKITLDLTNPEVGEWVAGQLRTFVEQGYRYLKLDFLYVGAVEAARHEANLTSLEAYTLACETIQHAVGEDIYLLASGEPILPSAGWFHAARTSSDICGTPVDAPTWRMTHNIARMNAGRFWTEGRLFANDPDQLIVRGPYLGDTHAEIAVAGNLLLGTNLWLGDALDGLSPDRRNLILSDQTAWLDSLQGPTLPLDLFDEVSNHIVYAPYTDYILLDSRTPRVLLRDGVLTLVNWRGKSNMIELTVRQLGFDKSDVVVATERNGKEAIRSKDGKLEFKLSGIEMKIYELGLDNPAR